MYLFSEEEELKETPPRRSRGLTQFLPWTAYSIDPRWLPGNSTPWALDILAQVQRHQSLRGKVLYLDEVRSASPLVPCLARKKRENVFENGRKDRKDESLKHVRTKRRKKKKQDDFQIDHTRSHCSNDQRTRNSFYQWARSARFPISGYSRCYVLERRPKVVTEIGGCSEVGYALSLTRSQSDLIPFPLILFLSLFQIRVVVVVPGGERLWMTQVIGNLGHRVMLLHPPASPSSSIGLYLWNSMSHKIKRVNPRPASPSGDRSEIDRGKRKKNRGTRLEKSCVSALFAFSPAKDIMRGHFSRIEFWDLLFPFSLSLFFFFWNGQVHSRLSRQIREDRYRFSRSVTFWLNFHPGRGEFRR